MNDRRKESIKLKMERLKKVKNNLETKDYTAIVKAAKSLKDTVVIGSLSRLGLVKNIDGIYHWVGGAVTLKMAEKLHDESCNRRKNSVEKKVKKTEPESPYRVDQSYNNDDVANMIEEFANQIRQDRAEMLSALNNGIDLVKVELFDLNQTLKQLIKSNVKSEETSSSLVERFESIENNVNTLISKAA